MNFLIGLILIYPLMCFSSDKGNGGGGLCLPDNRCIMLAESGFRIHEEEMFEVDPTTLKELTYIHGELPVWLKERLSLEKIVGSKGDIILIGTQNEESTRYFMDSYKAMIKKQDPNFDFEQFKIFGFSDSSHTYFIDKLYKRLNSRSRALLLMHESYIREFKATLSQAVKLDGIIIDYLENKKEQNLEDFDFWALYKILGDVKILDSNLARSMMVASLFQKGLTTEMLNSVLERNEYTSVKIDHLKSYSLSSFEPRIVRDLGGEVAAVGYVSREEVISKGLSKFLKLDQKHINILSGDLNEAILEGTPKTVHEVISSECLLNPGATNSLTVLRLDAYTSQLVKLNCKLENTVRVTGMPAPQGGNFTHYFPIQSLRNYLLGLEFNFSGSYSCLLGDNVKCKFKK